MSESGNKLAQILAIENGKGLRFILNEAGRIIGNPMLIQDMEYILIEAPDENIPDDPPWCDFMKYGRLSAETLEFIKNECFIDAVANCDGITYLLSDKWKYDRIFGQIYNDMNMPIADLICVASNRPFEKEMSEYIRAICKIVSRELGSKDFYLNYGQRYQEEIIKKLIEGLIEDKGYYAGHVANIDMGLKDSIFLAVIDLSTRIPNDIEPSEIRKILAEAQSEYKYYCYNENIVALLSSDRNYLRFADDLQNLNVALKKHNLRMGISESFHNLYKAQIYYTQALNALSCNSSAHENHLTIINSYISSVKHRT